MRTAFCLFLLAAALGLASCSNNADDLSKPSYLFDRLRSHWSSAKAELQKDQPDLGYVSAVGGDLSGPMSRMIEQEYTGPNKGELLKRLAALAEAYQATVSPKLLPTATSITLQPGVSMKDVRDAFMKLDPDVDAMMNLTK